MANAGDKTAGIISKLKQFTSDAQAYYITWKFAPELLPKKGIKTFEELVDAYACLNRRDYTEAYCETWLTVDEGAQKATRWLMQRLHQSRMMQLYDTLYKDVLEGNEKACTPFLKISKELFSGGEQKPDPYKAMLQGFGLPDEEDDEGSDDDI